MDRKAQLLVFLQSTPNDAFLNYALAQEYIALGNDEEALAIFTKLINLEPDYVATYYHLGKLLERKNEKQNAIAVYENGIGIAKQIKDQHAQRELQNALNELLYDTD